MDNIKALLGQAEAMAATGASATHIVELIRAALAPLAEAGEMPEADIQWLRKFINEAPQGAPLTNSDVKKAHTILNALRSALEREKADHQFSVDTVRNIMEPMWEKRVAAAAARAEASERENTTLKANFKGRCLYCVACDDRDACIENMGCLNVPIVCETIALDAAGKEKP